MKNLLRTREASKYLDVHPRTLYRMLADGRLPFQRIRGGHYRIRRVDVEAMLLPGKPRPKSE